MSLFWEQLQSYRSQPPESFSKQLKLPAGVQELPAANQALAPGLPITWYPDNSHKLLFPYL